VALEKELRKLAEEIPELSEFFGFWTNKNVLRRNSGGTVLSSTQDGTETTYPIGDGKKGKRQGAVDIGENKGQASILNTEGNEKAQPISRKAKKGPKIAFADAPNRLDMAWIDGNNIVINIGHASYKKCFSSARSRKLHCLFAAANAIQRYLGSESDKPDLLFIDRMMMAWGKSDS